MTQIPIVVKSTSFSRASDFERCPLMFKYRHVDKILSPAPELPEGEEHPMDRGSRIHKLCEDYIQNPLLKMPPEIATHAKLLDALRAGYKRGKVDVEIGLAFDEHWAPSAGDDFEHTRYRAIIDVAVTVSDSRIYLIDWKTGKKKGNEIKHHQQLMEYACAAQIYDSEIEIFDVAIAYIDLPPGENMMQRTFTKTEVIKAFPDMKKRHEKVLGATIFPPTPSQFACRFCDYKAGIVGRGKRAYPGTGHCRRNIC